jgi:ribosomal protein S8E
VSKQIKKHGKRLCRRQEREREKREMGKEVGRCQSTEHVNLSVSCTKSSTGLGCDLIEKRRCREIHAVLSCRIR